jgi:uncharacterized protein
MTFAIPSGLIFSISCAATAAYPDAKPVNRGSSDKSFRSASVAFQRSITLFLNSMGVVHMLKFFLYKNSQNEWRWNLKANNGEIIANSTEGYVHKTDARHAIDLIRNGAKDSLILEDKDE